MSLQRKLVGALLTVGFTFTFTAMAFAQQSPPPAQENGQQQQTGPERMGRRRGPGEMHGMAPRLLSQLNLTDAQRQQISSIEERYQARTKPQREEMQKLLANGNNMPGSDTEARMQALRAEMGKAMRGQREEILAVLTSDQRAQFEQLIKERKARHDARRELNQ